MIVPTWWGCQFCRVVREGPSDEVTFQQRPSGGQEVGQAEGWRESPQHHPARGEARRLDSSDSRGQWSEAEFRAASWGTVLWLDNDFGCSSTWDAKLEDWKRNDVTLWLVLAQERGAEVTRTSLPTWDIWEPCATSTPDLSRRHVLRRWGHKAEGSRTPPIPFSYVCLHKSTKKKLTYLCKMEVSRDSLGRWWK